MKSIPVSMSPSPSSWARPITAVCDVEIHSPPSSTISPLCILCDQRRPPTRCLGLENQNVEPSIGQSPSRDQARHPGADHDHLTRRAAIHKRSEGMPVHG